MANNMETGNSSVVEQSNVLSRREKRKALKKDKRKQIRKELAEKARAEEEAWLNDPEEQRKIQLAEEREKERLEREIKEFEEREKIFLEELERKEEEEEEETERKSAAEREVNLEKDGLNEDDEWEFVEVGPPEIIWQGNEIIVKKNKVRVKKKDANHYIDKEDSNRPTSNPLPPQFEAYATYKNELLDNVTQQVPNFGTEKDKAHCPFHIKTGACRFGLRCNRVHYYPDKSTTLLIKNMYNGPGLAWEQDEGLEYTDEEVDRSYEEFYEDVHTEFLKFGEIINFKVCSNGSFHLRGNVYIHYKSLDSAVMAYNSVHGRYFAGKQVKCEFVSLTRWKVAICGEYMKSRLKTCSRGSACNFLHCFRNPGGDYEWADCDKPPPRYWLKKMTALFGYSDDFSHDKQPSPRDQQHSSMIFTTDADSYETKRRQSIEPSQDNGDSARNHHFQKSRHHEQKKRDKHHKDEKKYNDTDSDGDRLDRNTHSRHHNDSENHSRRKSRSKDYYGRSTSDEDLNTERGHGYIKRRSRHRNHGSVSSNDEEPESDDSKHKQEIERWKPSSEPSERNKTHRRRSRRHKGVDEVDYGEYENEPFSKKQKRDRKKRCYGKECGAA